MGISEISWRNWCFEHGTVSASTNMATVPPLSNVLTPRTSELIYSTAIASSTASIEVSWTGGREVTMVAILNHNMIGLNTTPVVKIYDTDLNELIASSYVGINSSNLNVQRHMFCYFTDTEDFNMNRVNRVVVLFPQRTGLVRYGEYDEWSETYAPGELMLGGLWAGPTWRPENGIRSTGWGQGVTEVKRGAVSIGGQEYRSPEARRRRMPITFPLLLEAEVYGMDVRPPTIQRVLQWVGTSRPLIIIPDTEDPDAPFLQAIYGYLDQDPSWSTVENAGYTVTTSITEAL